MIQEKIRRIFDRIEEINERFRGMAPKRIRREKQTFASVLNEIRKEGVNQNPPSPVKEESKTTLAPATNKTPDFSNLITKYAVKNGLDPNLIRRIIEIESGFDPRAVSRKGAMGLMQLMPQTAKEMGVVNPFDPEENIAGGTRYLALLLRQNNGDLEKAIAAYNAGQSTVTKYGGIPPFPETQKYVAKVLKKLSEESGSSEE